MSSPAAKQEATKKEEEQQEQQQEQQPAVSGKEEAEEAEAMDEEGEGEEEEESEFEPVEDVDAAVAEAKAMVKEGKVEPAVVLLGRALGTVSNAKGKLHSDVAPVAFAYGKALLASARAASSVFGDAVEAAKKSKKDEAGASSSAEAAKEEAAAPEQGPEDEKEADQAEGEGESKSEAEAAPTASSSEDLDLCWDVLELARIVYERDGKKADLADVLLAAADANQEFERFEHAYADLSRAAEIHAELGQHRDVSADHTELAHCALFLKNTEKGVEHYRLAVEAMDKCVEAKPDDEELKEFRKDLADRLAELEESWELEQKEAGAAGSAADLASMLGKAIAESMAAETGNISFTSSTSGAEGQTAADGAAAPAEEEGVTMLVPRSKRKAEAAGEDSPKRAKANENTPPSASSA